MAKNLFKNLINIVDKNKFFIIAFLIFLLVRVYVLINFPKEYSDVKHDYERYANMWWYGLPPYFKHLYEYPPATIPLLIIPLALDQSGIGIYYFNYRWQIFFIETIIYFFILKTLKKILPSPSGQYLTIIFYNLACLIAKDFWYEGIDLVFIGVLVLAFCSYILLKKQSLLNKTLFWSLFWLSVGIKFITLPLFIPLFLIKNDNFKKEVWAFILGFLIIWGLPIAVFRSSLSVSLLFHLSRALHASSFPAFIVYTLNHFSRSEEMIKLEWFGPLSQKLLFWSSIVLIINTLIFLWLSIKLILKQSSRRSNFSIKYLLMLKLSLIYFLIFILSGKIFSPPFNIWYTLLLTIYPFKNIKRQLLFSFLLIWALIFNTTNIVKLPETIMVYPFVWSYLRNLFRWPPIFALLILLIREKPEENHINTLTR